MDDDAKLTAKRISNLYYRSIIVAYGVGIGGWLLVNWAFKGIWSRQEVPFDHPWLEVGLGVACAAAVILIGQARIVNRLLRIPKPVTRAPVREAINQAVIWSPFAILLVARGQGLDTAWLKGGSIAQRIAVGLVLGAVAVAVFCAYQRRFRRAPRIFASAYHPRNLGFAVQVFAQDVSLGILLVRFRAATGSTWFVVAIAAVALVFSAGHYPGKMREGALSFIGATREVVVEWAFVFGVLFVAQFSQDVLWLYFVHYSMDMMQFYGADSTSTSTSAEEPQMSLEAV